MVYEIQYNEIKSMLQQICHVQMTLQFMSSYVLFVQQCLWIMMVLSSLKSGWRNVQIILQTSASQHVTFPNWLKYRYSAEYSRKWCDKFQAKLLRWKECPGHKTQKQIRFYVYCTWARVLKAGEMIVDINDGVPTCTITFSFCHVNLLIQVSEM